MKDKYKIMFMEQAEAAAKASEAVRKKVGCVLVKDGEIISVGLNGMPPKWPTYVCEDKVYADEELFWLFDGSQSVDAATMSVTERQYPYKDDGRRYKLITKEHCRHAEVAALEKMWKSHNTTEGAECFVTLSPCLPCSIKLNTAGIKKVYYREQYRTSDGLEYLKANNIEVEKI